MPDSGVDLHRRPSVTVRMNQAGEVLQRRRFENLAEAIAEVVRARGAASAQAGRGDLRRGEDGRRRPQAVLHRLGDRGGDRPLGRPPAPIPGDREFGLGCPSELEWKDPFLNTECGLL
jgi:hypothetical protein